MHTPAEASEIHETDSVPVPTSQRRTDIRCPSPTVFPAEVSDYFPGKEVSEIHYIMRYTQLISYLFSIFHGIKTAATTKSVSTFLIIRGPDLHGNTNNFIAFFLE